MMDTLIEICRIDTDEEWHIIENSNFNANIQEGLAAKLLNNAANEYAEYKNCGVVYRIIRKKDLSKYI